MPVKVEINFGFIKASFDVDFTDKEKQSWINFLSDARDYRILSSPLEGEYVGQAFSSVVRLRDIVLSNAEKQLPPNAALRTSYGRLRKAVRDFLSSVHNIPAEQLNDRNLNLSKLNPIGYQWIFISSLTTLRAVFLQEIEINSKLFKIKEPEEFAGYKLPEAIANDYAEELAPTPPY